MLKCMRFPAEKPSLQSRHSLDSSRVQEKEAGPLWITLALQKQKGFREQQQNREERRSQRESKLAEKQSRDNVCVMDRLFPHFPIFSSDVHLILQHSSCHAVTNVLRRLHRWARRKAKEVEAAAPRLNLRHQRSPRDLTASWDALNAENTWKKPTPYPALSLVRTCGLWI